MNFNKKRKYLITSLLILLIFFLCQIRLFHIIKVNSRIYPSEEWLLVKNQNDVLTTSHINHLNGGINQNKIYSLERGDIASIMINPDLRIGSIVQVGDTIVTLVSNETELLKSSLIGELALAEKNLKIYQSAENIPIVEQARQMYEKALSIRQSQKNIYERSRILHENNLISDEEFEIQKSTYYSSEADANIAKSHLDEVNIGSKPEIIELQKQVISNLKEQSQLVSNRIDGFFSIAPFKGTVTYTNSLDTLLLIQSADNFVTIFPIPLKYSKLINIDQEIELHIAGHSNMKGQITSIDDNINIVHGKPIILISVAINNNSQNIFTGQNVIGKVNLGKQKLINILYNYFN